jgi:hypothetical protein
MNNEPEIKDWARAAAEEIWHSQFPCPPVTGAMAAIISKHAQAEINVLKERLRNQAETIQRYQTNPEKTGYLCERCGMVPHQCLCSHDD